MKSFLLFAPATGMAALETRAARATVVPDGFSWLAFIAPVPWFLYHRCWLAALAMFMATLALFVLARFLQTPIAYPLLALTAAHTFAGLEAGAVWGRSLRRRGLSMVDVVVARNYSAAEHALISRMARDAGPDHVATAPAVRSTPIAGADVVGLFPEPEIRR